VHLGVVFTVEADGRPVAVREHEKLTGAFVETDAIADAWDRLETWSQLVARALELVPAVVSAS
jgi:predicted NUDIX family phosphoesterase